MVAMMLDWIDCPVCIYRHPFRVPTERPCPNESLTEARCQAIFNKGLDQVLRAGVNKPVNKAVNKPVVNKVNKPAVNKPAGTETKQERIRYMREYMRKRRQEHGKK